MPREGVSPDNIVAGPDAFAGQARSYKGWVAPLLLAPPSNRTKLVAKVATHSASAYNAAHGLTPRRLWHGSTYGFGMIPRVS
ncbi:hypothetical protein J3B00_002101 [Pseudomonas sp. BP8]|nr:hypothetical protein [Pseudomonas sp. BP8]